MDYVQPAPYRLERITKMANLVDYVKTVWENGKTALNAARMNNMEQGISDCATQINKLGDSVCQLDTDGGTTECAILLRTNNALVITAKNKSGRCVSLNFYSNEIVVYDEVAKKRICAYAKTE